MMVANVMPFLPDLDQSSPIWLSSSTCWSSNRQMMIDANVFLALSCFFNHFWHRAIYILYSDFFGNVWSDQSKMETAKRSIAKEAVAIQRRSCDRRQNSLWTFDVSNVINCGLISLYAYRTYAWTPEPISFELVLSDSGHNDVNAWCTVC